MCVGNGYLVILVNVTGKEGAFTDGVKQRLGFVDDVVGLFDETVECLNCLFDSIIVVRFCDSVRTFLKFGVFVMYFVELARNNAFVGRQVGQCFGNSIQAGYYITIIFVAEITVGYRQGAVFKPVRYG